MKLTKYLKAQGYDLIIGPVRNHKPLQMWVKQAFNEAELYYSHLNHAFESEVALNEIQNSALNVSTSQKEEYGFNIGITVLEEILKSLGLGTIELSAKVKSGKKVSISYDNSKTIEIPIGEIENYLARADFKHPNPALLKNANRNNILILTGTVFAKNLVVDIETDFEVDAELMIALSEVADGKLDFTMKSQNELRMVSSGSTFFPIAVKASRVDFDKGVFKKLKLVTDNRNFF